MTGIGYLKEYDFRLFTEALKLNRMFMEQTGGSDAVLLTAADVPQETTIQTQKSPLIPACVEEQLLNAPQVIADLASPVGAHPQYLQPQASSAQQPSPTTQVAPQQPVILQAQPQQQPLQHQKVTLTSPLQQGQLVALPVNSTSVPIPAGFTLCQLNGECFTQFSPSCQNLNLEEYHIVECIQELVRFETSTRCSNFHS